MTKVAQECSSIPSPSPDLLPQISSEFLRHTIQKSPAFPVSKVASPYSYSTARTTPNCSAIMEQIKLCINAKQLPLCGVIFEKMRTAASAVNPHTPLIEYYLSLTTSIDTLISSDPALESATVFSAFFRKAAELIVLSYSYTSDSLQKLTIALKRSGGVNCVKELCVIYYLAASQSHQVNSSDRLTSTLVDTMAREKTGLLKVLMKHLFSTILPPPSDIAMRRDFAVVIISCVKAIIKNFDVKSAYLSFARTYPYSYGAPRENSAVELLTFSFTVGVGPQTCNLILDRLMACPPGIQYSAHLTNFLVPFIPLLRKFVLERNVELKTEPCASFCAKVVRDYARMEVGQKPSVVPIPNHLKNIGCGGACTDCPQLRAFFTNGKQSISFKAVQRVRTHLEHQLNRFSARASDVQWTTEKHGTPHQLVVFYLCTIVFHPITNMAYIGY